jgi:hypothetical protein
MKIGFRKILAAILSLAVVTGMVPALGTVKAKADTASVNFIDLPNSGDPNQSNWGHPLMYFMNGRSMAASNTFELKTLSSNNNTAGYCLEPGIALMPSDTVSSFDEVNYWKNYPSDLNKTIDSGRIQQFVGEVMQFGYLGPNSGDWVSSNAADADKIADQIATQILIWEIVAGERDYDFNHVDAHQYNVSNFLEIVSPNHPLYAQIMANYNRIVAAEQAFIKAPSFTSRNPRTATKVNLNYDGTAYSATLTDTNIEAVRFQRIGIGSLRDKRNISEIYEMFYRFSRIVVVEQHRAVICEVSVVVAINSPVFIFACLFGDETSGAHSYSSFPYSFQLCG